jgi:hypothetical protein
MSESAQPPAAGTRPPRRRSLLLALRRAGGWIVLLALGAEVLYLLAANLLIKTPLLRTLINSHAHGTTVEYSSASTLWPGRVEVDGLRIRDQDYSTEWILMLDHGRARIVLLDLLRRRFHAVGIRGDGFQVRIRSRLDPPEATPGRLAFLPEIPGYPGPPVREPGERRKPPGGAKWTIVLDDIRVDPVREIWVDQYRYEGEAGLEGGLFLHVRNLLRIPRSSLAVRGGSLSYQGRTIAGGLAAKLDLLLHDCDLHAVHGKGILTFLSGAGDMRGVVPDVGFLNPMLNTPQRLRFEAGKGSMSAGLRVDRGVGEGSLRLEARSVRIVQPDASLRGDAVLDLRLARIDLLHGVVDFSGSRLSVAHGELKSPQGEARDWQARLVMPSGAVLEKHPPEGAWRALDGRLELQASEARPLYELMNVKCPAWAQRLLRMHDLSARADLLIASSRLEVRSFDASGGALRVRGTFRRKNRSNDGTMLVEAGIFAVGIDLKDGSATLKMFRPRTWFRERMEARG